jgi:hypothetical protein
LEVAAMLADEVHHMCVVVGDVDDDAVGEFRKRVSEALGCIGGEFRQVRPPRAGAVPGGEFTQCGYVRAGWQQPGGFNEVISAK